jgi:ubiquinone/menaquinone biosynthesis C-methylase UbiE
LCNWAIEGIAPGDRVLFLTTPEWGVIAEAAERVGQGVVVCLAERETIQEWRRRAVKLENVMFVAAGADEIPWQDGFFSWVFGGGALVDAAACREAARVVTPGGCVRAEVADGATLESAGLVRKGQDYRKPEEPPRERGMELRVLR